MNPRFFGGILLIGAALYYGVSVSDDGGSKPDDGDSTPAAISQMMGPMYAKDQRNKARIYRKAAEMVLEEKTDEEIASYISEEGERCKLEVFDDLYSEVAKALAKQIGQERSLALNSLADNVEGIDD